MIFVWIAVAVAAASYVMAVQAQKKAQKAADDMKGVLFNKESNIEPIPVVYGTRRVGGVRVYVATKDVPDGDDNEFLYIALVLCEGEVNSITDIEVDGNPITDSQYTGLYTINAFTGANGQGSSSLIRQSDSAWTTDARLRGVAYLAIKLKWDEDAFQGIPTITALVQGKKIYDPRQNVNSPVYDASVGVGTQRPNNRSTWLYSDNPALCIRDYLTDNTYGKGLPESAIDYVAFAQAADDCEELFIPFFLSLQRKLFRTHTVLQTDKTLFENIEMMLMGCRGFLPFNQGQYSLVIDKNRLSTFSFNLDNMTSGLQIKGVSKDTKYNQVTVKFANEAIGYEPDEVTYPSPTGTTAEQAARTAYLAEDNGTELALDVDLETVTNVYVARDFAQVFLRRSRAGMVLQFKATSEALNCSIGDTVTVTHPSLSPTLVPKLFQVSSLSFNYDGEVSVQLLEFDSTAYTYDTMNEIADFEQPHLPDPFTVAAPSNLTGSSSTFLGSDGTVIPVITVTWTAAADSFVNRYIVEWKKTSESSTAYRSATIQTTTFELTDVVIGTSYNVNVYSVNALGVKSEALSITTAGVGDTTAPAKPTAVTATSGINTITLNWVNPSDSDFSNVKILRKEAGTQYIQVATVSGNPGSAASFSNGGLAANRQYFYRIKSVDFSGNQSDNTNAVNAVTSLNPSNVDGKSTFVAPIYLRATSTPATPTGGSFNFGTNALTTPTDWFAAIPIGTDPVYYSQFVFSIVGDTGTVNGGTWSAPVVTAENGTDGTDGTDGLSTFRFNIYKRAAIQPAAPTGGSYNFTTNHISTPTQWYSAPPSGTDPMWVSTGTAQIAGATGTDSTITWSPVAQFVVNGAAGDDGPRNANGYIYFPTARATAPAQPGTTGNYSFSSLTFANLTNGWVHEPPEYVAGSNNTFWAASYTVTEATFNGTQTKSFSAPYKAINFDGLVTFTNLNNTLAQGSTIIDGDRITTGTIEADRIEIDGAGIDTQVIGGKQTLIIGDDGVTTVKIDDLAVTEGKIANLAVDTLKIKDQAVTIPIGAYTNGEQTLSTSWSTIQSISYTTTGSPVILNFATELIYLYYGTSVPALNMEVRVRRGSTVLADLGNCLYGRVFGDDEDDDTNARNIVTFTKIDTPSIGSVTYTLQARMVGRYTSGKAAKRSITAIEAKK
ncbi:fibronectin type III domain-containing protein [bacterium]|nr:fibronectin type III domain-containing protein [bacterium]